MATKKKKFRGWTDRLYLSNLRFAWSYTYVCVVLSIFGGMIGIEDYSFVSVGLPLVWAELGIHTAFVVWKTKAENMVKMGAKDNILM